ncbi:MAG: hypothetical protein KC983_07460 [Phycisphaerales bacterium]|nr:hypothetical protein [Phycisphaerales bacterium]
MPHDLNREPTQHPEDILPDDSNRLDEEPVRAGTPDAAVVGDHVGDEPALRWRAMAPHTATMIDERRAATRPWARRLIWAGAILVSVPASIFGLVSSTLLVEGAGWGLTAVVLGPLVEQMLRIAGLLWIVEKRPWLITRGGDLIVAACLVGVVYGVTVVGLLSVASLADDRWVPFLRLFLGLPDIPLWARWVLVPMHTMTAGIAGLGLFRIYRSGPGAGLATDTAPGFAWFVAAMVVHVIFNVALVALPS